MSKKNKDFGIEKTLKKLGIKSENKGASTGNKWFASGKKIESYSPTDGKLIATVTAASTKDYEKVIEKAQVAFKEFRIFRTHAIHRHRTDVAEHRVFNILFKL